MLEVGAPAAQLPATLPNHGCMEEQMLNQVQHDGYKKKFSMTAIKKVQHDGYKKNCRPKILHLSPKRTAYIWMKITVKKRIWVLRALALSRAQGKGEVWRGKTCGLRTLSGFSPSKLGVQGITLEKNFSVNTNSLGFHANKGTRRLALCVNRGKSLVRVLKAGNLTAELFQMNL